MNTYGEPGGVLEALADPTRRGIFESLVAGPQSVRELADALPVSRPAVSQHLRVLKEAGLVADRAEGTRRVYHVVPDGVSAARAYFDRMWDHALTAFKAAAAAEPGQAEDHRGQQEGRRS